MLHVNVSQSSLTSQYSSAKLRLNMGLETSQWKIHSISFVLMLFLTHFLEFAEGSASHISDRKKKKKQKLFTLKQGITPGQVPVLPFSEAIPGLWGSLTAGPWGLCCRTAASWDRRVALHRGAQRTRAMPRAALVPWYTITAVLLDTREGCVNYSTFKAYLPCPFPNYLF